MEAFRDYDCTTYGLTPGVVMNVGVVALAYLLLGDYWMVVLGFSLRSVLHILRRPTL